MNKSGLQLSIGTFVLLGLSFPVQAHTGITSVYSFTSGFIHPWLGLDHTLVMIGIGLWAALANGRWLWSLPATFLSFMTIGLALGFAGLQIDITEQLVALSVLVTGLVLAYKQPLSGYPALFLVAVFAISHGYVHAIEVTLGSDALIYALGLLMATILLHIIGFALGLSGFIVLNRLRKSFALLCILTGVGLLMGA